MKQATSKETLGALIALSIMGNIPEGTEDYTQTKTSCGSCKHIRSVSGNCHVLCSKVDITMTGKEHGIKNGWFAYPFNFDPIWRTSECASYEEHTDG